MTIRERQPDLEEFLRWPEEKPYLEFIHGQVRAKVAPDFLHGAIQARLCMLLGPWSDALEGWVLSETRCLVEAAGKRHLVLPDVAWWPASAEVFPPANPLVAVPTLVVEILSPDDRYGDVQEKVLLYLVGGVEVVWVVDPRSRNVAVYHAGRAPEVHSAPDVLEDEALPELQLLVAELFGRLPHETRPRIQE